MIFFEPGKGRHGNIDVTYLGIVPSNDDDTAVSMAGLIDGINFSTRLAMSPIGILMGPRSMLTLTLDNESESKWMMACVTLILVQLAVMFGAA